MCLDDLPTMWLRRHTLRNAHEHTLTTFCVPPNCRLKGSNIEVFSLHPGVIQTPLGRHVGTAQGTWTGWLFGWLGAYWIKSTEQARAPAPTSAQHREGRMCHVYSFESATTGCLCQRLQDRGVVD